MILINEVADTFSPDHFPGHGKLIKPRRAVSRISDVRIYTIANSQQVSAILLKNRIRDDFRRPEIHNFPGGGMLPDPPSTRASRAFMHLTASNFMATASPVYYRASNQYGFVRIYPHFEG